MQNGKRTLLWVGDACVSTGFAKATHHTLDVLRKYYNIVVLGMNYNGDPHGYPYPIFPARVGGSWDGAARLAEIVRSCEIDLIVLQNDVWNIPPYITALRKARLYDQPVIAALAVDGPNVQAKDLDEVALSIFWTKFAAEAAAKGGWKGPTAIVPLGVDLDIFKLADLQDVPKLRAHARSLFASHPDASIDIEAVRNGFIVGAVNRNQQRKRLDLLVAYFCDWVRTFNVKDAYLYIHAAPTGEQSYDIEQLMEFFGCKDRLLLVYPEHRQGDPEAQLAWTYRAMDIMATTTQGEGFGLTTFEAQACGIPCIAPRWSALGELGADSMFLVECTSIAVTPNKINAIGGVPDQKQFVRGLDQLYRSRALREALAAKGLAQVRSSQYRWENVGEAFANAIREAKLFPEDTVSTPGTPEEREAFWTDFQEREAPEAKA